MKAWWGAALLLLLICITPVQCVGQVYQTINYTININDVSIIRINPYAVMNMSLLATTAGETMTSQTNATSYLQLTSIAPVNQTRRITAAITSGMIPPGTKMDLTVSNGTSGVGNCGTAGTTITLLRFVNQTVINNIASGYTGGNTGNGFKLAYTWQVDQNTYGQLRSVLSVPIIITYTITNN